MTSPERRVGDEVPGPAYGPTTPRAGLPHEADEAVTELYAAHWHRLVRLAWLLLRDQAAAEDAVQDAFVATHRNWASIRDSGRVVGYLQTAVVNRCRSVQRHHVVVEREAAREAGSPDTLGRGTASSAEAVVLAGAERRSMMAALDALSGRQREVLVLRYYLDLSEAQIASALDISAGSVKAHASRGLSALRRTLEQS
ncbi:MAG TPA: SigE family RNA polymerase sigma factor [Intrasporangium sp.]|uniref:RNA polymerase sigma factor n=1 Tax=Intrasporangium sp. TaxID=1925024 RepID=UPI002D7A108B|nr:SigE family RNA polymerase sigma factor [Intrasporangium sp.]HET7397297.1 SigE family RNA polymerase sigma factor [Intrasporangium sp.]